MKQITVINEDGTSLEILNEYIKKHNPSMINILKLKYDRNND